MPSVRLSLSDVVFAALLLWLLAFTWAGGSPSLLHDACTGVHIRTGEYILDHRTIPAADIFSFSRSGQPWFAWEWLTDVGTALLFRAAGLKAVVLAAAVIIAFTFWLSLKHAVAAGANPLIAIAVLHVGIGASSHHFLARPHILTLLFFALSWRWLDRDHLRPTRAVWLMLPLTALWVNFHGGFVALPVSLALFAVATRRFRYAALAGACALAGLLNPHGWHLFGHLATYLRAGWIRQVVEEFQPARLDTPTGVYFEVLLFAGLGTAALLAVRGKWGHALLIAAWAHASLLSMRHIPIYFLIAGPMIASTLSDLWRRWSERLSARAVPATLWRIGEGYRPQFSRSPIMGFALAALLLLPVFDKLWPSDFPAQRYPVALARENATLLSGTRLFTVDAWADFLVYEFYPRQRVFFDGRTDFYGQELAREYVTLLHGESGWRELMRRHGFDAALLPADSPLAALLRKEAGWKTAAQKDGVVLLLRPPADAKSGTLRSSAGAHPPCCTYRG